MASRMPSNRRVAVFVPALAGGGAERVFLDLAEALGDLGWSVDLVAASASGPLLADVPENVRLIDFGISHVTASIPAFARYLRKRRPDAVLSAMTHANLVAIAATALSRVKTRVVVTEHTHLSTFLASSESLRGRAFPLLMRLLYPYADEVVAVSSGVADDVAQRTGLPRESIRAEKNPIRIAEMRERGDASPSHPWFAEGQPPVVLGVGRLTRQKDFGTLLRAFRKVRDQRDSRLLLLGEGEDRPMLEALISRLGLAGDVEIAGFVTDPYPYFNAASVFALSSRWEGLPTVLLEAMVFGLPIISTDCPSGPDEILEGGTLGTLVPVEDPDALAAAILEVLSDAGSHSEYRAVVEYDIGQVAGRYSDLLTGSVSS